MVRLFDRMRSLEASEHESQGTSNGFLPRSLWEDSLNITHPDVAFLLSYFTSLLNQKQCYEYCDGVKDSDQAKQYMSKHPEGS